MDYVRSPSTGVSIDYGSRRRSWRKPAEYGAIIRLAAKRLYEAPLLGETQKRFTGQTHANQYVTRRFANGGSHPKPLS